MENDLRRIALEAIVIAALGALIGLSFHYRLLVDALGEGVAATRSEASADADFPTPVGLTQARDLLRGGAVAIDARIPELFREGHLPGAVSLPLGEADAALPELRRNIPAETILIVYCSGYGCPDSFDLALRLIEEGYREVRVFEGGLPAWRDAGLPVAREER